MLRPGNNAFLQGPVQLGKESIVAGHLHNQIPVFLGFLLGGSTRWEGAIVKTLSSIVGSLTIDSFNACSIEAYLLFIRMFAVIRPMIAP